jgi:succinate dehydrogenase / fumarate reductase membrane anchor subunit
MNNKNTKFRSKLSIARGLGSAKSGVTHWWVQRVTAVAMIPLSIWFLSAIISVMMSPDVFFVTKWFSSPVNTLLLISLIGALFFHAKLGLQVVIEDYIKCPYSKYSALLANTFFCFGGATLCIIAVLKLHFLDVAVQAVI